jgi:hypothetical protein
MIYRIGKDFRFPNGLHFFQLKVFVFTKLLIFAPREKKG